MESFQSNRRSNLDRFFMALAVYLGLAMIGYFSVSTLKLKANELAFQQTQFEFQKASHQKDAVRFCQEMAATATNANWQYKNCLTELGITDTPTFRN
jgi:hypothetical protein